MDLQTLKHTLQRFHHDERGAESLEKLLLIGVIVIPLLGVLLYFRNEISQWVKGLWTNIKSEGEADPLS